MHSYNQAFYALKNQLQPLYDEREAAAMAHELLEHITGLGRTARLMQKNDTLTPAQQQQYDVAATQLAAGTPLQYTTGKAWFMGHPYTVNKNVLIPRPETEELVDWIVTDSKPTNPAPHILDIGTGSGCIPIALKLLIAGSTITTCDISSGALAVAAGNAAALGAGIQLLELNFLNSQQHSRLGLYDIIVSNPPYIPLSEQKTLHTNVRDHEPALALFVPDGDALIFYRAIATFGLTHLCPGGAVYCELDAAHAQQCQELFATAGYSTVRLRQDMSGNWRMLRANV